jgi:hypothetical protein
MILTMRIMKILEGLNWRKHSDIYELASSGTTAKRDNDNETENNR